MSRVIEETEAAIDFEKYYTIRGQNLLSTAQAISHAACSVACDLDINTLVTMTHSGSTARMTARYRPVARIIAMTPFPEICRKLAIVWESRRLSFINMKMQMIFLPLQEMCWRRRE